MVLIGLLVIGAGATAAAGTEISAAIEHAADKAKHFATGADASDADLLEERRCDEFPTHGGYVSEVAGDRAAEQGSMDEDNLTSEDDEEDESEAEEEDVDDNETADDNETVDDNSTVDDNATVDDNSTADDNETVEDNQTVEDDAGQDVEDDGAEAEPAGISVREAAQSDIGKCGSLMADGASDGAGNATADSDEESDDDAAETGSDGRPDDPGRSSEKREEHPPRGGQ
jgi:hypothetical protein